MNRSEVEEKVRTLFSEQLQVDRDQVTTATRFREDLDVDSLDLVEATLALEDALGIKIPEEEMEDVETVGEAVELVAAKLGAA
ncbi:MAG: acyl carrier protein [Actinomycetota bacterium]|nr:acyl carrier protein [Actinomycetota bacterium]